MFLTAHPKVFLREQKLYRGITCDAAARIPRYKFAIANSLGMSGDG